MDRVTQNAAPALPDAERLERLIRAIERLDRRLDQFFGVFLNARFLCGKPTDRWARRS
jgi:hypothetical protein